jgi:uncharacterized protein (TIGR02231 family)
MKKINLLLLTLCCCFSAWAQKENVQRIQPPVKSIMLYLDGVEYDHMVPIKLTAGRNLFVFEGLSAKLDPTSIRVNAPHGVSVLSVTSSIDYLVKNEEKPRIRALRDSVTLVTAKIQLLQDEWSALSAEREILLRNQAIGGQQNGVNVLELQKAADYYYSRTFEINKRVSQISTQTADLTLVLMNLENELSELNARVSYQRAKISVLLSTEQDVNAELDLRYYVSDAGWAPYYELKSDEIGQPVDLIYRARVYNNTGIDWENVSMVLSTGDPTKSVTQPKLDPWKLNYEDDIDGFVNKITLGGEYDRRDKQKNEGKSGPPYDEYDTVITNQVQYTTIEVSQLSVEFPIKTKYSIPSVLTN